MGATVSNLPCGNERNMGSARVVSIIELNGL